MVTLTPDVESGQISEVDQITFPKGIFALVAITSIAYFIYLIITILVLIIFVANYAFYNDSILLATAIIFDVVVLAVCVIIPGYVLYYGTGKLIAKKNQELKAKFSIREIQGKLWLYGFVTSYFGNTLTLIAFALLFNVQMQYIFPFILTPSYLIGMGLIACTLPLISMLIVLLQCSQYGIIPNHLDVKTKPIKKPVKQRRSFPLFKRNELKYLEQPVPHPDVLLSMDQLINDLQ